MAYTDPIDRAATQRALGLTPDGIFGRGTYGALLRVVAGPKVKPEVIASLANAATIHLPAHGIDASRLRLADFLAQCANETGGFVRFEEDLRWSAKRIHEVFPHRFPTIAAARPYAWDPSDPDREDIAFANKNYGGRIGNEVNGIDDDDGWLYRGQGMLQLTGKGNYESADKRLGIGLGTNPEMAAVPALSLLIACDFYRDRGVLAALDRGDTVKARAITNGGSIGLADVNRLREKLLGVIL